MSDPYEGKKNPIAEFLKKRWLGVLIVVLALIFVLQNGLVTDYTTVQFYFWQWIWPNWLLLTVVFFAGWLVGWLFSRRKRDGKQTDTQK